MACLDESTVVDLLGQRLDEATRQAALAHLKSCEVCHDLVVAVSTDEAFFPTEPATFGAGDLDDLPSGALFGRFRLLRVVGEGGVGVVYEAREDTRRETVALKVLKEHGGSHTDRFRREAKVTQALSHPAIANVIEVVEHEGRIALVAPLLIGESLDRRVLREAPLPTLGACRVLATLADALAYAHAHGVVHRDVKPQNVFLLGAPGEPLEDQEVRLLDFGLAKALGADLGVSTRLTESGVVLGTPHYMAPEQIVGSETITVAADAWALGVVAYECLSGVRPVEGKSFGQIFKRLTQETVVSLADRDRGLGLGLPRPVVLLVDALLSAEPSARPSLEAAARILLEHAAK